MHILVTGGGGFLGKAIIRRLIKRGDRVTSMARNHYPELESWGVRCVQADIGDQSAVAQAAAGVDAIIHTAAKAGIWGRYDEYYRANVVGTANVIRAAEEHKIKKIVYTSSPSVIFDGHDQNGLDESTPYPTRFLADYPRTKAMAEQLVTAANGAHLATVSLRPHLIWGPGDPHIMPRIIKQARAGRLFMLGHAEKRVDAIYVDNAADAHLLALDRLQPQSTIAGRIFFITNHEPWPIKDIINHFLRIAKLPPAHKTMPPMLAYAAGSTFELLYRLAGKEADPPVTRFMVKQMATSHWYNTTAAQTLLGFQPKISMIEGMQRLADSYS